MNKGTVTVFYCYSRRDEFLRDELSRHLSVLRHEEMISDWYDGDIEAGDDWDERIRQRLNASDLVLLLISANFLASNYCYKNEMTMALERHKSGNTIVIPILLRPIDWGATPFSGLKPLPKNRKPITLWKNHDKAFASVAKEIRREIKKIYKLKQGDLSIWKRVMLLFNDAPQAATTGTSSNETSFLRVRFDCPTCGKQYYVTVLYASAKFCCRLCGCIEVVPHELQLFGMALAQGKISRDLLAHVVMRKLEKQDINFTIMLLQKEMKQSDDPIDEISESDIIERFTPEREDLVNSISVAKHAGYLDYFEERLAEANLVREEPVSEDANAVTDAMIKIAIEDEIQRKEVNQGYSDSEKLAELASGESSIFPWSRLLCCYCVKDEVFGRKLANHLEALKQRHTISRVGIAVVDSGKNVGIPIDKLVESSHIVVVLMSTNLIATEFCQSGGIDDLLQSYEKINIMLIPVLVHPMAWQKMTLSKLQFLPTGGQPLSAWSSTDEACANVADEIGEAIRNLPIQVVVKVAERGDAEAMFHLSMSYMMGYGVNKNVDKAIHWLRKTAEIGYKPSVMFLLGLCLQKRESSEALQWMLKAAESGHVDAMSTLAEWYDNGTCGPQDLQKGFEWCLKAVEAGKDNLLLILAGKYFEGVGTSPNQKLGNELLKRGAEKGITMAMVHLGNSYFIGRGVSKDIKAAREWWQMAWASGDEEAMETLKKQGHRFWENGKPGQANSVNK